MKRKKITTLFFLVITFFLFGAVIYVSVLLNNTSEQSITSVRKTKASSQTYHKLLAVNIPIDPVSYDSVTPTLTPIPTPTDSVSVGSSSQSRSNTAQSSSRGYLNTNSPTIRPTTQVFSTPTVILTPKISSYITSQPITTPIPTVQITPTQSPLLAYGSQTKLSPTLIPVKETGAKGSTQLSPTKLVSNGSYENPVVSKVPTRVEKLPDSGWIQTSSLLFIIAATTILFSLLF